MEELARDCGDAPAADGRSEQLIAEGLKLRRAGNDLEALDRLQRAYELRQDGDVRRFARRGALLAALDRVRLNLLDAPPPDCAGRIQVALDLTSLPTPLRFPAFLQPSEWRLVSPPVAWHSARN